MKKKIIVSDDDKEIINILTLMLEDAGYEVRSTSNGHTTQLVEDYLPDLLLLDIWMAEIDGRDVCKELKNKKHTKHVPIIMISADRNTENIAREAGANDFISKPFDMDELLEKIARYV